MHPIIYPTPRSTICASNNWTNWMLTVILIILLPILVFLTLQYFQYKPPLKTQVFSIETTLPPNIIKEAIKLISLAKIDAALAKVEVNLQKEQVILRKEIVFLKYSLNKLRAEKRKGIVSREAADVKENCIVGSLLTLLTDLERNNRQLVAV